MKKFSLPNEFHNVDWKTKHNLVKKFINEYKNTKKELLDRGGRFKWNTSAVLELLTLLNLEPLVKNFEYKAYYTPFNVRCTIHNHTFDTRFELISKGQICSYCLSTVKGFSQFEAEEKAREFGYTLIDSYKGYHEKHWMICPKGHKEYIPFIYIFKQRCKKCGIERKRNKLRFPFSEIMKLFSELKLEYPSIELLTTEEEYQRYKGYSAKFKIRYTCVYCGKPKEGILPDIKAGYLMHKECAYKIINVDRKLSYQEVVKRFNIKGLVVMTSEEKFNLEYKNNLYKIDYKCKTCGYNGIKTVKDIISSGCPVCNTNYYNKPRHVLQQWSDMIKSRHNYTCFNCGYYGTELHAHHLFSKKYFPEFAKEIWCGIALCPFCHIHNAHSYHKYANKLGVKSTPGIFIDWIKNWGESCKKESDQIHLNNKSIKTLCPKDNLTYIDTFPFSIFKEDLYFLN